MSDVNPSTSTTDEDFLDLVEQAEELIGFEQVWSGQLLYTSVELGVIDLLGQEPTPATEVADTLDLHDDNCYRFLRALAHFDILEEDKDRRFSLTPVGELFQSNHSSMVRQDLLVERSTEWVVPMQHLGDVVRDGPPNGFVREFGCELFDYLEENPDFGEVFNAHMTSLSQKETRLVLEALDSYDFSEFAHVCDVGGGHGHLLCHLLDAHPHLEGTVLELPSVIAEEERLWAQKVGVGDRCTYEVGDMFEEVPEADAHFMKYILHDWEDGDCIQILSNIHDAAPSDGRLFIVEAVVPGPETSHFAKQLDMTMMVHLGGKERTKAEYATLLERADWTLHETWVPDEGPLSILEAVKT